MTLAALESLARKGVLYFNLHTRANTFYGEVRGQSTPRPIRSDRSRSRP
jgi:hypothetical protein